MLSKAEILYLQGEKQFSASYEYKLKSILKKKITNFLDKELPLLTSLFPDLNLTKIRKNESHDTSSNLTEISKNQGSSGDTRSHLTRNSKTTDNSNLVNPSIIHHILENSTRLNHDKLYNCHDNTYQKKRRVRSVVRISRRSSETVSAST